MRILFLSTWFPFPADNGSKIRAKYLLRALNKRHEVTLLSFAFATAQPELVHASDFKAVHVVEIDPYFANRTGDLRRFISLSPVTYRPIPEMKQLVETILAASHFDVVIASTELMATYALQAGEMTRKVLEEHNSLARRMSDRYHVGSGIRSIRKWVSWQKMRLYERRLFAQFDLVTMVSQEDFDASEQLLNHSPTALALVPNGVDCSRNSPGAFTKKPQRLIFNGSLSYQANYQAMDYFLSRIYPLIRERIAGVKLTITGSNTGVDLDKLPLDKSVSLSGFVEDIRPLVGEATLCVVPLLQGGGTRLKILEAMALGTPVISTSKGAEGLEVVDGEHLLLADKPREFADKVVMLLGDADLQHQLQLKARRFVEQEYDWQDIGERFVTLVERTVTSPAVP